MSSSFVRGNFTHKFRVCVGVRTHSNPRVYTLRNSHTKNGTKNTHHFQCCAALWIVCTNLHTGKIGVDDGQRRDWFNFFLTSPLLLYAKKKRTHKHTHTNKATHGTKAIRPETLESPRARSIFPRSRARRVVRRASRGAGVLIKNSE